MDIGNKIEYRMMEMKDFTNAMNIYYVNIFGVLLAQWFNCMKDYTLDDGGEGFQKCYEQSLRCSEGYLKSLGY
ncbi:hypothetical protein Avbf_13980 [Armadillidium vulgare]|nr:hypothetical protein Avbf_13980 [Armadillidium vulgare]